MMACHRAILAGVAALLMAASSATAFSSLNVTSCRMSISGIATIAFSFAQDGNVMEGAFPAVPPGSSVFTIICEDATNTPLFAGSFSAVVDGGRTSAHLINLSAFRLPCDPLRCCFLVFASSCLAGTLPALPACIVQVACHVLLVADTDSSHCRAASPPGS